MTTTAPSPDTTSDTASKAYACLIGLASIAILLQGVWAGVFLQHDDSPRPDKWINVHARGADVAIVLTLLATIVAVAKLRDRRPLVIGTGVLLVLLILEAFLGGRITDNGNDAVTIVHIPLGMAIMGVTVWLSVKAVQLRKAHQVSS